MSNQEIKLLVLLPIGFVVFVIVLINFPIVRVSAGHRAVLYNTITGQKHIANEGTTFRIPFIETVTDMSVQEQKSDFEENAGTKDSQSVDMKVTINWHLDPAKVSDIYTKVGSLDGVNSVVLFNNTQDSIKQSTSKYVALEIQQNRDTVGSNALHLLQAKVKPFDVIVDSLSITNINFTSQFNAAVEAAAEANQRAIAAENKVKQTKAEAESAIAQAQGTAEAQKLVQESLTPELLQKLAIERWDGHFPQYMLGGNTLPFINVPTSK